MKILGCFLFIGLAFAQTGETPIKFKDLPAAVQKAATEQSKGAKVKGYNKEVEDGKTFYEVETTVGGKAKDILLDETGAVAEVEQAMDLATIPPAAKAGIEKLAAGAKILTVESVTKGSDIAYEATVSSGGKKHEVKVAPDGSPMK